MSSLQRESKIYGAVESQSYITFTGFCKRIYDTAQQSVDVFIDEEKVATLLANEKIRDIEEKYEVFDTNGFCFTYELPKKYIGQKHKLEFKTQEGKQLLHSPTHTIDKFSPLYNQVMFIESLHQPIQYHALENGYTKNALSFIAIEENLGDEAFIEFILEMSKKYKELSLSIFYFNEHQKNQATKIFNQIKNKNFINPSSVEEIIKNSEIYVYNVIEEFRFASNEEYYDKVKNIQAIKENLFMVELTRKAKKKKDMAEMEVEIVTPILFESSIVSEIFKEDERYNEFIFLNSLGQVNEEKIKNMYGPNSIGFLATQKNLGSEEFIEYVQDLVKRFPKVTIKGFCFNEKQFQFAKNIFSSLSQVNIEQINTIDTFVKSIEVFIYNPGDHLLGNLLPFLRKYTQNILSFGNLFTLTNYKEMTIEEFENHLKIVFSKFMTNIELLGIKKNEISEDGSYLKTMQYVINKRFNLGDSKLNDKSSINEIANLKLLKKTLQSQEFKKFYFEMTKKQIELMSGKE